MRVPAPEELDVLHDVCRYLPVRAAEVILSMPVTGYDPFIEAYVMVHDDDRCPAELRAKLAELLIEALDGDIP